nr:hypothetical protein HmN_000865400 [Hymenolepis microstoma]
MSTCPPDCAASPLEDAQLGVNIEGANGRKQVSSHAKVGTTKPQILQTLITSDPLLPGASNQTPATTSEENYDSGQCLRDGHIFHSILKKADA